MSELPWVRFFPSDWLAGTRGMSAAEAGVYISLIAMMYERGEPLVEDASRLARLCGASNSQFKKALENLVREAKIVRVEGGLWNNRVAKEAVYRSEKSDVAKRAAEIRWGKDKQNQSKNDAGALPSHCDGSAIQKPDIRNNKKAPSEPKKDLACRIPDDWQPDDLFALREGLSLDGAKREAAKFRDYWQAQPGAKGRKTDWTATWRNWVRKSVEDTSRRQPKQLSAYEQQQQRYF